jgi:hypothetical protein
MVIQKTIENLRERSEEERRTVALTIAIAVVVVLLIGWTIFFLSGFRSLQVPSDNVYVDIGNEISDQVSAAQAAAGAAVDPSMWVSVLPTGSEGALPSTDTSAESLQISEIASSTDAQ